MPTTVLLLASRSSGPIVAWGVRREARASDLPVTGVLPKPEGAAAATAASLDRLVAGRLQAMLAGLADIATQVRPGDSIEIVTEDAASLCGAVANVPDHLKRLMAVIRRNGIDISITAAGFQQEAALKKLARQLDMTLAAAR
ncbi:hypothetical protein LAZ40_09480 [Cereibacter sphaeroides]|uniref:hypothetical protein n=1 Tax=Cereibacter sphaeroides TaxID=1063 RepID=UPI001F16363B|nr:hypothetical protein [Cereibacter sphaeroides]MCE6959283.1 hypothetical protein [Cereibacter sphaeroides]MCE6972875.1 hypothetical protein [Cereibacter sphaeroides]